MTKIQNQKTKTSIWWIRNDLRLYLNESLTAANNKSDYVIPLYILDQKIFDKKNFIDSRSYAFLYEGLANLNRDIKKQNGQVLIKISDPISTLKQLCKQYGIDTIYTTGDYSKEFRDIILELKNIYDINVFYDNLINPKEILNKQNKPYKVFTRFANEWKSRNKSFKLQNSNKYKFLKFLNKEDVLPSPTKNINCFLPGVKNASDKYNDFVNNKISSYHKNRDYLFKDGTSKLSAYIKFGMLSLKNIYNELVEQKNNEGVSKWIDELLWREFYIYISYYFPKSLKDEFQAKYTNFAWETDIEKFNKWKYGNTGYPIVDACMKQLISTGWMHNRGRMIVASFLTKDLLIDWRMGEKWFMEQLIDGDPASNVGGWQWTAGCGVDAAPYFRIFNPVLQSKRFDPQAKFIKKWIPELATVDIKFAHEPWLSAKSIYIPRMINHSEAKVKILNLFKSYNE